MNKTIAIATAFGVLNLSWDAYAKTFNPDHDDKADPGFAIVQASTTTTSISVTISVQQAITGDIIEAPQVFELTAVSARST